MAKNPPDGAERWIVVWLVNGEALERETLKGKQMARHNFRSLEEMAVHLDAFEAAFEEKPHSIPEGEVLLRLSSAVLRLTAEVAELRERVSQLERPSRSGFVKAASAERTQAAKRLAQPVKNDGP